MAKEQGINSLHKTKEDLETLLGIRKTATRPWQPARMLDVGAKEDGFRYRWRNNDPAMMEKAKAEGWAVVDTTDTSFHKHPRSVDDGSPLGSAKTYRELVLMRTPEENALARDEYYAELNRDQVRGLKRHTQDLARKAARETGSPHVADVHGKIVQTIE